MTKLDRFKIATARRLRATMTDAERILWLNLSSIPLEGTHFRRQEPIGPYFPDFISLRLKLIVEVDGPIHENAGQRRRDLERTVWFEREGYRIIRFSNFRIQTDMNSVLAEIEAAIAERKNRVEFATGDTPPRR